MQGVDITPDFLLFVLHLWNVETAQNLLSRYVQVRVLVHYRRLIEIKLRSVQSLVYSHQWFVYVFFVLQNWVRYFLNVLRNHHYFTYLNNLSTFVYRDWLKRIIVIFFVFLRYYFWHEVMRFFYIDLRFFLSLFYITVMVTLVFGFRNDMYSLSYKLFY